MMYSDKWHLSDAEFKELTEQLRFNYYKWDIYVNGALRLIPESIVISREDHNFIVHACETLSQILRRTESYIKNDRSLLKSLNIPDKVMALIAQEPESSYQLARYDFFLTEENRWQLSEFNEDVPGGFNDAIGVPRLLSKLVSRYANCRFSFERDLGTALLESISDQGPLGLVYATAYAEDLQHMLVLKKCFEARGQSCLLHSPSHLRQKRGRPFLGDSAVSTIIRFYPAEWFENIDNLNVWSKQLKNLKMFNPLYRLISQSKKIFAIMEQMPFLSPKERSLLSSLIPETYFFSTDQRKMLLAEKEKWVIKEAFGRMGDTVYIGRLMDQINWQKMVETACKRPEKFLIQKFFHVKTLGFSTQRLYPALGAYVINGKFGGYYSRASSKPILTHEAYYVPTLVEDS